MYVVSGKKTNLLAIINVPDIVRIDLVDIEVELAIAVAIADELQRNL